LFAYEGFDAEYIANKTLKNINIYISHKWMP
jgi:hypothetical protein